ncbi:UMP-CMP kinase 2, mitochondrial-like [Homalodisca vitripennis]|uniref:UMP-CMP kinase 2, mitochondrial-like n=1 Tax=Homalodisca vitripennis TaxID=197043 RepID=UPI001EEC55CA|nr:UMP-CMP kinase 2, mitochondrial-like [Homalodisca vitripennis]
MLIMFAGIDKADLKQTVVWLCIVTSVSAYRRKTGKKIQISVEVPDEETLSLPLIRHDGWVDPCFYSTMDSVLEVWKNSRAQYKKGSNSLMSLFINKCFSSPTSWDDRDADKNRKPFINIESDSYQIRDEVASAVSKALKGQLLTNPPRCLRPVWYIYGDRRHGLHRPYMALGMYGSSHAVKVSWVRKPVVMTGYWYDLVAATITGLFPRDAVPPPNSTVYRFPQDLILPDLTVFVTSHHLPAQSGEDKSLEENRPLDWKSRYTSTFLNFPNADIHEVKYNGLENVTQTTIQLVQSQLGQRFKLEIQSL